MRHRGAMPAAERAARSRLAKLLHERPLLRGSVVSMARTCGKAGCKCTRGEKHVSMYLSVSTGGKSKMIYIPAGLEGTVRTWVGSYRETQELTREVAESCLERLLARKQEVMAKRPESPKRQRKGKR